MEAATASARLLVVDDEATILELLSGSLRLAGFEVVTATTGAEAVRAAASSRPDLVLLDVMMPDGDGFEALRRIRSGGCEVPVIFVTARDEVPDHVKGFAIGGDDYVTKPFSLEELLGRIRAVLKRTRPGPSRPRLRVAGLELDEAAHEVKQGGAPVALTPIEYRLLRFLMVNAGRVVSKGEILDHVWEDPDRDGNVVEPALSYLQQGEAANGAELLRLMGLIAREAGRMGQLVDDLLLLARFDVGRPLDRRPVDLASIAAEAVQQARIVAPGRPITLEAAEPVIVDADAERLRQIIDNLLGNAIAHTPPGSPVTLTVTSQPGSGRLTVADRGPGMTPEQASRVFERFYRSEGARARAGGGSGLGLAIAASLAAAHGGELSVDTQPGRGAAFHLHLPSCGLGVPLRNACSKLARQHLLHYVSVSFPSSSTEVPGRFGITLVNSFGDRS